jgi:hypothetical protein
MNIKTKLILAASAVTLLSAPASARFDGDEGVLSAYPRFGQERAYSTDAASAYASAYINPRQQRVRYSQPRW